MKEKKNSIFLKFDGVLIEVSFSHENWDFLLINTFSFSLVSVIVAAKTTAPNTTVNP
jgi:hypothetical protein